MLAAERERCSGWTYQRREFGANSDDLVGEKNRAIPTLTRLLKTPYAVVYYAVTPALLRLDPIWDPLRSDPAFQKLCEEKQP